MTFVYYFGKRSGILQGEQLKILAVTQTALPHRPQVLLNQFRS